MESSDPAAARRTTGDQELDDQLGDIVSGLTDDNSGIAMELLVAAASLVGDRPDRLDLKIAGAALHEMRDAFATFAPYAGIRKVTVFGSARTDRDDPAYSHAHDVAADLASRGWMVVTGAGPGIMIAANEGAGVGMSFGVNIRLPFETEVNALLHGDEKLVEMKYFFTRKLMLMKESSGFVALPGGFGTQDETFELLTLQQTGKADPTPIVMLDVHDGTYWSSWQDYVSAELEAGGLIGETDRQLYKITSSVEAACSEIVSFWSNHHSIRYVGDRLVMRMQRPVDEPLLTRINEECGWLAADGLISRSRPLKPEIAGDDELELPRLTFRYGPRHYGKLRSLIDLINLG